MRQFFKNLLVNLAAGFILFFFSERLFWTVFRVGDQVGDLAITWLAYSVLACVLLNILKRFEVGGFPRIVLAGAVYGWLAEGALVGTLYGTEASAPFPISIVQTALSWHTLISVVVGWHLLISAVRQGKFMTTAMISVGVGIFWGVWAPFLWRETPPVIVPVWAFGAHAVVVTGLVIIACGFISGPAWAGYKPGWLGLTLSCLFLGLFFSEQVKALGLRPLIMLPLLVGGVLGLLYWSRPRTGEGRAAMSAEASRVKRWGCAAVIGLMPFVATFIYTLELYLKMGGINPVVIFNGLAIVGGLLFFCSCVLAAGRGFKPPVSGV